MMINIISWGPPSTFNPKSNNHLPTSRFSPKIFSSSARWIAGSIRAPARSRAKVRRDRLWNNPCRTGSPRDIQRPDQPWNGTVLHLLAPLANRHGSLFRLYPSFLMFLMIILGQVDGLLGKIKSTVPCTEKDVWWNNYVTTPPSCMAWNDYTGFYILLPRLRSSSGFGPGETMEVISRIGSCQSKRLLSLCSWRELVLRGLNDDPWSFIRLIRVRFRTSCQDHLHGLLVKIRHRAMFARTYDVLHLQDPEDEHGREKGQENKSGKKDPKWYDFKHVLPGN